MTFLRTSASRTPSNFGTPTRLDAASAVVVNRAPSSSARNTIGTRRAIVVTRPDCSIRNDPFTRSATRGGRLPGIALMALVALGCATAAPALNAPRIVFDRTSRFGRVLVIDEGPRRVMRFGSPSASDQSAIEPANPRAVPIEYVRYAFIGLAHHGRPRRVLMIGLGGGTLPTLLH